MSADVVVIGAGIGGLSAAMRVAAAGLTVRVLEAGPRVGGKADEARVGGGAFDTGPSVLTLPDVFEDLFERTGVPLSDRVSLVPLDPAFRYVYPDGVTLDVHADVDATLASVEAALGHSARVELEHFLAYSRRLWEIVAPTFVRGPAPDLPRLMAMGPRVVAQIARIDAHRSMWRAITSRVSSPHLRWLLARYATYNGSDPRRAPATLNCIAWVEMGLGGHGVHGGMHALPLAMARRVRDLGGRIETDRAVAGLVTDGAAVRGVRLADGEAIPARAVVANADVAHVISDLVPTSLRGRMRAVGPPSTSGWTAVVRSRRRAGRAAHTVVFPHAYLDEFQDMFDEARPPRDPTVYACAQGVAHQRRGWGDDEPVFLMANAPAEPAGPCDRGCGRWSRLEARVMERATRAGLIDPDDPVVWRRTPHTLASRYPRTRGAIYGASSNHPLAAFRRPHNRVKGLPGLYLASGSAHPGGGVPLCALSGSAAADALLQDLRVASPRPAG